jgi:hypothetical protein
VIGAFDFIVSALAPSGLSKVVAQSPIVARGLLLPCTVYAALRPFVARGSLLSCTTYAANCPCGKGLIDVPIPVSILGKWSVVALFGKGFVVALLDKCGLLGVLYVLALVTVHAVFGVLAVLALGNVHAFSNVFAILSLGIFALLIIALRNMVIISSCEGQHESLIVAWDLFRFSLAFLITVNAPCNTTYKENNCHVVDVVLMASQSISLLALCAFAIVDLVDPHQ